MIPATALALYAAIETRIQEAGMPLKPRIRVKAQGRAIFVGKDFEAAADAAGDIKVNPKKKHRTLNQQYASRNRKRFKGVAK